MAARCPRAARPYRAAAGPWPAGKGDWEPVLADLGLFGEPVFSEHAHVPRLSPEELVALVSSWSWVANLPGDQRTSVLDRVSDLVGEQAEVELDYVTESYSMIRSKAQPRASR